MFQKKANNIKWELAKMTNKVMRSDGSGQARLAQCNRKAKAKQTHQSATFNQSSGRHTEQKSRHTKTGK